MFPKNYNILLNDASSFRMSKGLTVWFITSTSNSLMIKNVIAGNFQLASFTPEALLENKKYLQEAVYMARIRCFVLDEAHTMV